MDLALLLNTKKHEITAKQRHNILMSIANAIIYLHEHGFAHRDIKVENILIKNNNHAILCDLDHSYPLNDFGLNGTKEYYPTVNVMKALICNRKDISISMKMKWIDFYAFGKTIGYVMVMTEKEQDKYQLIWSKWLTKKRTSCYPYIKVLERLKEESVWWNFIYHLCILNERNIFNPSKKMIDLRDLLNDMNKNF